MAPARVVWASPELPEHSRRTRPLRLVLGRTDRIPADDRVVAGIHTTQDNWCRPAYVSRLRSLARAREYRARAASGWTPRMRPASATLKPSQATSRTSSRSFAESASSAVRSSISGSGSLTVSCSTTALRRSASAFRRCAPRRAVASTRRATPKAYRRPSSLPLGIACHLRQRTTSVSATASAASSRSRRRVAKYLSRSGVTSRSNDSTAIASTTGTRSASTSSRSLTPVTLSPGLQRGTCGRALARDSRDLLHPTKVPTPSGRALARPPRCLRQFRRQGRP